MSDNNNTATATTVTRVRVLPDDGEVFLEGTDNVLWQDGEGNYYTTSWAPGPDGTDYPGDTVVYASDENGNPDFPTVLAIMAGQFPDSQVYESEAPEHTEALALMNLVESAE